MCTGGQLASPVASGPSAGQPMLTAVAGQMQGTPAAGTGGGRTVGTVPAVDATALSPVLATPQAPKTALGQSDPAAIAGALTKKTALGQ